MNHSLVSTLFIATASLVVSQSSFASIDDMCGAGSIGTATAWTPTASEPVTATQIPALTPMLLAAGPRDRAERRQDHRENSRDRIEDKQDHREGRRDCVGDGANCRSDNRQDNRGDRRDRSDDRRDDRQERR